jgi:hypothetical protein
LLWVLFINLGQYKEKLVEELYDNKNITVETDILWRALEVGNCRLCIRGLFQPSVNYKRK